MGTVFFKSNPCHTSGELPSVGMIAPDFSLCSVELNSLSLDSFSGKRIVLNIFPSLDTDVCAMSVRRFNQDAAEMNDVIVLCVSMDLPFAMSRFCVANGIENVVMASAFRSPLFSQKYGVMLMDGPLAGLLSRAVVIIDKDRKVLYSELVEEIANEPDYESALSALGK